MSSVEAWNSWEDLYIRTHCTARGLKVTSIIAYLETIRRFQGWAQEHRKGKGPKSMSSADVLGYVEYLRKDRKNGDSAVNRAVTVIRNYYRAMVSMGQLDPVDNPMAHFPKVKQPARKLPDTLTEEELPVLISQPNTKTIIGVRDQAILTLISGTGIRVSECSQLDEKDVDLEHRTIRVKGKGGHDRVLPLNNAVIKALGSYLLAKGRKEGKGAFFLSRYGKRLSRGAVYERVRKHGRESKIGKKVTPHALRHAFATHLVRVGVNLVTIRDLLGHRQLSSTQIYLHMTARDLREATDRHPVAKLVDMVSDLLPDVRLPFQKAGEQGTG